MNANDMLEMMRKGMGEAPAAIEQSVPVDPVLMHKPMRSRTFAMPAGQPALDADTRTLICLAAACAATSLACVKAMATRIIGDAEPVFDPWGRLAST